MSRPVITAKRLRQATPAENRRNRRAHSHRPEEMKGVYPLGNGRWRAIITVNSKSICLGTFALIAEAWSAYAAASKRHHGEFGRVV